VVKPAIEENTGPADERLEEDQPSAIDEHAPGLAQERIGGAQVMKHVEQDQMRDAVCPERQLVTIADDIQPAILE